MAFEVCVMSEFRFVVVIINDFMIQRIIAGNELMIDAMHVDGWRVWFEIL